MFSELAPGIFSVAHRFVDGRNGIVIGRRGAVAIDVCNYPDEGTAMAAFMMDKGCAANRVILTHGHGDHVLGGQVFVGGDVFAHARAPDVMRRLLPGWAERTKESLSAVMDRALWPTITFTDELRIDLGDKTLHIFPTPGHSEDSVCVYVPEARVLFAGDTAVTGIVPAIGEGDGRDLERSLQRLLTLDIEILVAGHGPVLQGAAVIREWLTWLYSYLIDVRAYVREKPQLGVDTLVNTISFERFIGDRLPADQFNMLRRHRNTVLKIIAEERSEASAP